MEEVEVVVAHRERATLRVGDVFRSLTAVRWLVEAGYGPPEEYPEMAVLRANR